MEKLRKEFGIFFSFSVIFLQENHFFCIQDVLYELLYLRYKRFGVNAMTLNVRTCTFKQNTLVALKIIVENGKHLLQNESEHSISLKVNFGIKIHPLIWSALQCLTMSQTAPFSLAVFPKAHSISQKKTLHTEFKLLAKHLVPNEFWQRTHVFYECLTHIFSLCYVIVCCRVLKVEILG